MQEEWPVKVVALPHSQLSLYLNILEDSKGRRRPKYHYWAVQKVFPTRDWTNTQGNLGKNSVNPLKTCKIWVECGCFRSRRLCCCRCWGEVSLAAAVRGGSGVFLLFSWSCPGRRKARDRKCRVRCRAGGPCAPSESEHWERAVWNQVKTSVTNSTDKVFKSPLFLLPGNAGQHTNFIAFYFCLKTRLWFWSRISK